LAAYRQAVSSGVDAVECDVRLTLDGVLVCVHDRRIHRTSSGRGVASTLTLTDLE
jgi:glycerophosphoryl diester phosphodiesterase